MKSQTFIYNYGLFNSAMNLFEKFNNINNNTYLLNCKHPKDPDFKETDRIKKFDNIFYSGQWNEMLKIINSDIILIICSDVNIENATVLHEKMMKFYKKHKEKSGIYAPNAYWTPWTYNPNLLKDLGDGCKEVIGTDSMIWSLASDIAKKIGNINLNINKIGWGIELLASFYCKKEARHVVKDYSIKVYHPKSSAYNRSIADIEFKKMINLLPNKKEFWDFYELRNNYQFGWQGEYKYIKRFKYHL